MASANDNNSKSVFSNRGMAEVIEALCEEIRDLYLGDEIPWVVGYSGGKAKALCDVPIHFPIDDMQISEDMQLVIGHMLMQWLWVNREALQAGAIAA